MKQRRLGEKRHLPRRVTEQYRWIDESVGMIEHEDDGRLKWYMLQANDFNSLEINPHRES